MFLNQAGVAGEKVPTPGRLGKGDMQGINRVGELAPMKSSPVRAWLIKDRIRKFSRLPKFV